MKKLIPLVILVMVIDFIAELIGTLTFTLGTITISVLPLVFAVILGIVFSLIPSGFFRRLYSNDRVKFAGKYMIFIMLPLMARYGADVAPKINEILSIGWVFLIHEAGNLGTILFGLPIALLLGIRREAIGSTLGLGREGELAYISEKYTLDSPEGHGVLGIYLIGTVFGSIVFSILAPLLLAMGFDFRAVAMSSGVGSASMMTAASSALVAIHPAHAETITSYAAASQLLTSFIGTYIMYFIAVPLQRFIYNHMTAKLDKHPVQEAA
ncbi:DUF3100 domain-containing protein [Lacticaseibacillus nasuensis]|uniref:DUF3100 domain-containing protein n=1 Tax=Lacticaseibacillus nasuensis TaxID=944671 RepID=UPI0022463B74|nr:DUF3100 domain-containing protein [Lacticaseibacillus nasuensis]MCX2456466.1 DUF3100 domain-containing protein [Lacticaseibacillus nasuensis]